MVITYYIILSAYMKSKISDLHLVIHYNIEVIMISFFCPPRVFEEQLIFFNDFPRICVGARIITKRRRRIKLHNSNVLSIRRTI